MIVLNFVDELHQGLEDHWNIIRPEMKSVTARLRVFSLPGAPVVAMSATATDLEVSGMIKNLGLRQKPVILRASPVQAHHKFVTVKRPANTCDPEGKQDKFGKEKPGLIQLLNRIYLAKYIENMKQNLPVKKGLILFRTEKHMMEVFEYVKEQLPGYDDMTTIPFTMNHGGLGPATIKNIIARKNEISLFLATSKMLMGIDIEEISVIIFVRPMNMMHYILQGKFSLSLNVILHELSKGNREGGGQREMSSYFNLGLDGGLGH